MRKKVKFPRPKFRWDKEYGVGYIYLNDGIIGKTVELLETQGCHIVVDLDKKGNVLGLEIVQ